VPRILAASRSSIAVWVDDDSGARSVGQLEDLVDLLTVGDDPFVGAEGLCQLDRVGVAVRRSVAGSATGLDRLWQ
jgi:hypothetical protein